MTTCETITGGWSATASHLARPLAVCPAVALGKHVRQPRVPEVAGKTHDQSEHLVRDLRCREAWKHMGSLGSLIFKLSQSPCATTMTMPPNKELQSYADASRSLFHASTGALLVFCSWPECLL